MDNILLENSNPNEFDANLAPETLEELSNGKGDDDDE